MILRRLTEHVKAQNWFAVAIDFAIVVIGVFVGMQVSNWNAARQDRVREAAYLAGIEKDLRGDIVEIDEIIRVSTVRMSALNDVLVAAAGPLPESFLTARGRVEIEEAPAFSPETSGSPSMALFILTTFEGNRLGYESMINMDGISLVRDAALLRSVQSYYAGAEDLREFEDSLNESRVALIEAQRIAGISPVDGFSIAALAAAFGGDPGLLAAAENYWLYTNRHMKLVRELRLQASALLDRIDAGGGS